MAFNGMSPWRFFRGSAMPLPPILTRKRSSKRSGPFGTLSDLFHTHTSRITGLSRT